MLIKIFHFAGHDKLDKGPLFTLIKKLKYWHAG